MELLSVGVLFVPVQIHSLSYDSVLPGETRALHQKLIVLGKSGQSLFEKVAEGYGDILK